MSGRAAALEVRVRLLPEPCLWCWEIVDAHRRGALAHSSWAGEWMAYGSQEEALAAGCARLAELRSARANAGGHRTGENAA